jgi:3-oxoadipate enol-lactonase
MPYSTRDGVRVYYEVYGEGPPLVLVHANPFDHRLWMNQIARFSAFYRIIAVDLRGYGRSDKPEKPFTLSDLTGDVLGVCDQEGVSRAIFAGVSVGSGICMQIGIEHPDKAHALVLVGGSSRGPRNLAELTAGFDGPDLGGYMMTLMRRYVAPGFADTPRGRWALGMFVERVDTLSARSIAQVFRARGTFDMSGHLAGIRPPVLVINGEHDGSLPAGQETASMIPGARHVVLPNSGHACCIEEPEAFDAAMIEFLDAHGLWAGRRS